MVTAAWPVAPAAAWISTVWPAATWPSGRSAASAVGQLTTRPRACSSVQPAGTGTAAAAASTRYSAKAPPVMLAPMTWSPAVRPVTPAATVTTSPAASRPARYGGRGPSGNVPRAWEMSAKLTPAAVTRMRISPGPAAGTGTPVTRRRSRGPFSEVCSRARMVAGTLMVIVPSWYGRTAGGPAARKTRRERERNRSGSRREPEHGDQAGLAEGGHPADARAGDGEHADSVRLVVPGPVPGPDRRGGLPVGAGGPQAPVARQPQQLIAQERHAGPAAGEPGPHRGRLQGGVGQQEPLQGDRVGVFERLDVLVEQRAGLRRGRLAELVGGRSELPHPGAGPLQPALDRHRRGAEHDRDLGGGKGQHVPQDQDGPLPGRQVLQAGDERQPQAFAG